MRDILKNNKVKIILSSIVIILPALFGLIFWNKLPDSITTHFGADGSADGFSGKAFVIFGLPLIMLAMHVFCLLFTLLDQKQREQSRKALNLVFWIIPVISVFANTVIYSLALGKELDLELLAPIIIGVSFVLMGNYMPKIKQNRTLGIKLTWTVRNEENWNLTHRLGGKVMVVGGFVIMLCALLPTEFFLTVMLVSLLAIALVPTLYSYSIYKKHKKSSIEYFPMTLAKSEKTVRNVSLMIIPVILAFIALIMFTGEIDVSCESDSLEIDASYWSGCNLSYSEIDSIEYSKELTIGTRTNGFSSAKLQMGIFTNKDFGSYTLYAYTSAKEFVVIKSNGKTLVIGLEDSSETAKLYQAITKKTEGDNNA